MQSIDMRAVHGLHQLVARVQRHDERHGRGELLDVGVQHFFRPVRYHGSRVLVSFERAFARRPNGRWHYGWYHRWHSDRDRCLPSALRRRRLRDLAAFGDRSDECGDEQSAVQVGSPRWGEPSVQNEN